MPEVNNLLNSAVITNDMLVIGVFEAKVLVVMKLLNNIFWDYEVLIFFFFLLDPCGPGIVQVFKGSLNYCSRLKL